MTSDSDFIAALAADPDDVQTALVYADFLDDHADDTCPDCFGTGDLFHERHRRDPAWACHRCLGSGHHRTKDRDRAAFIRLQCAPARDRGAEERLIDANPQWLPSCPVCLGTRSLYSAGRDRPCDRCLGRGRVGTCRRGFCAAVPATLIELIRFDAGREYLSTWAVSVVRYFPLVERVHVADREPGPSDGYGHTWFGPSDPPWAILENRSRLPGILWDALTRVRYATAELAHAALDALVLRLLRAAL